jgi:hypothetical protein
MNIYVTNFIPPVIVQNIDNIELVTNIQFDNLIHINTHK